MRHSSLLLAATLAIAGLSAGCESWDNEKTPDLTAATQEETGPTEGATPDNNGTQSAPANHNHSATNESTTGTSESR